MDKLTWIILFLLLTALHGLHGQVSVSAEGSAPDSSSMLDVKSASKGILIPRVSLTGTGDTNTVPSPATSLMIYNTATTGDVTPGFYYWEGGQWHRIAVGGNRGEAWNLKGNAGTTEGTHFLGTTDGKPLSLRVNNQHAGQINFLRRNTLLGQGAGEALLTSGSSVTSNTITGYLAGNQITGIYNTFYGAQAGSGTAGDHHLNSFFGALAGSGNTGSGNVFFGYEAGKINQGGSNVFLGNNSGDEHTTGSDNTFVGVESGQNHISGSSNTALGFGTKFAAQGLTNATAIGAQAQVGASNSMVLGAIQGVNFAMVSTNVGIGTTTPTERLDVAGKTRTTNFQMTQGASNGFVLRSDNLGNASWVSSTTLPVTESDPKVASAIGNRIPKWNGTSLADGLIHDNGNQIGIGTTAPVARVDVRALPTQTGIISVTQSGTAIYAEATGIGFARLASALDVAAGYFSGDVLVVNGQVGIGTLSPDTDLEVEGISGVTTRLSSGNGSDVNLDFRRLGNDWRIRNSTGLLFFGQSGDDLTTVNDVLRLGGGSVTPAVDNAISLGGSSLRWTQVFAVNGTISTSDGRLKKEVEPLSEGLGALMKLRPVTFAWKDDRIDKGKRHSGFIAQEVMQAIPEAVVTHEWREIPDSGAREWKPVDNLGINYDEITPVLVKAIQEQQKIIEQLREEIDRLKKSPDYPGRTGN